MDNVYRFEKQYHKNKEIDVALCLMTSIKDVQVLAWANDHFNRGNGYFLTKHLYLYFGKHFLSLSKFLGRYFCQSDRGKDWFSSLITSAMGLIGTIAAYYDVFVDLTFVSTLLYVSKELLVSLCLNFEYDTTLA